MPRMDSVLKPAHRALLAICLAVAVIAVTGCSAGSNDDAPAVTVQRLLELRASNSTDTAAYLRHVEETSVAEAIVEDAAQRSEGESATPEWKRPRVEKRSGSTAEVVVEWVPSGDFKDWPKSTTFIVKRVDGGWRVIDATETTGTAE